MTMGRPLVEEQRQRILELEGDYIKKGGRKRCINTSKK